MLPRASVASRKAASFASVPLLVKKTRSIPGAASRTMPTIRSANSICEGIRKRVEVWAIRSSCSLTGPVISAMACPLITVTMPPKRSR